jgi:hypothetical protein
MSRGVLSVHGGSDVVLCLTSATVSGLSPELDENSTKPVINTYIDPRPSYYSSEKPSNPPCTECTPPDILNSNDNTFFPTLYDGDSVLGYRS